MYIAVVYINLRFFKYNIEAFALNLALENWYFCNEMISKMLTLNGVGSLIVASVYQYL